MGNNFNTGRSFLAPSVSAGSETRTREENAAYAESFKNSGNKGIRGFSQFKEEKPSKAAQIANEQYDYYQENFVPVEREFAGLIKSPGEIESLSENAGISASRSSDSSRGEFDRNIGRYGMNLDPTQKKEVDQRFDMGKTGAVAGAKTRTRESLYDMNTSRQGEFVGLGRNLATSSLGSISKAEANEAQRQATNDNISAQNSAGKVQLAASIGIAAAVIF